MSDFKKFEVKSLSLSEMISLGVVIRVYQEHICEVFGCGGLQIRYDPWLGSP